MRVTQTAEQSAQNRVADADLPASARKLAEHARAHGWDVVTEGGIPSIRLTITDGGDNEYVMWWEAGRFSSKQSTDTIKAATEFIAENPAYAPDWDCDCVTVCGCADECTCGWDTCQCATRCKCPVQCDCADLECACEEDASDEFRAEVPLGRAVCLRHAVRVDRFDRVEEVERGARLVRVRVQGWGAAMTRNYELVGWGTDAGTEGRYAAAGSGQLTLAEVIPAEVRRAARDAAHFVPLPVLGEVGNCRERVPGAFEDVCEHVGTRLYYVLRSDGLRHAMCAEHAARYAGVSVADLDACPMDDEEERYAADLRHEYAELRAFRGAEAWATEREAEGRHIPARGFEDWAASNATDGDYLAAYRRWLAEHGWAAEDWAAWAFEAPQDETRQAQVRVANARAEVAQAQTFNAGAQRWGNRAGIKTAAERLDKARAYLARMEAELAELTTTDATPTEEEPAAVPARPSMASDAVVLGGDGNHVTVTAADREAILAAAAGRQDPPVEPVVEAAPVAWRGPLALMEAPIARAQRLAALVVLPEGVTLASEVYSAGVFILTVADGEPYRVTTWASTFDNVRNQREGYGLLLERLDRDPRPGGNGFSDAADWAGIIAQAQAHAASLGDLGGERLHFGEWVEWTAPESDYRAGERQVGRVVRHEGNGVWSVVPGGWREPRRGLHPMILGNMTKRVARAELTRCEAPEPAPVEETTPKAKAAKIPAPRKAVAAPAAVEEAAPVDLSPLWSSEAVQARSLAVELAPKPGRGRPSGAHVGKGGKPGEYVCIGRMFAVSKRAKNPGDLWREERPYVVWDMSGPTPAPVIGDAHTETEARALIRHYAAEVEALAPAPVVTPKPQAAAKVPAQRQPEADPAPVEDGPTHADLFALDGAELVALLDSLTERQREALAAPWPARWLYPAKKGERPRGVNLCAGCGGGCKGKRLVGDADMICVDLAGDAVTTSEAAGCTVLRANVKELDPEHPALRWTEDAMFTMPCPDWTPAGKRQGHDPRNLSILLEAIDQVGFCFGNYEKDGADYCTCEDDGEECSEERGCFDSYGERTTTTVREMWSFVDEMTAPTAGLMLAPVIWCLALRYIGAPLTRVMIEQSSALPDQVREDIWLELVTAGCESAEWDVMDAADYGSPSHRRRAIMAAHWYRRPGLPGELGLTTTAADAIGWAPDARVNTRGNRRTSGGNEFVMGRTVPGITSKIRSWYNAETGQRFTIAEVCKLVGLPEDYPVTGSRTSQCQQLGDVLSPLVAAAVWGHLLGVPWRETLHRYLAALYPQAHGEYGDGGEEEPPAGGGPGDIHPDGQGDAAPEDGEETPAPVADDDAPELSEWERTRKLYRELSDAELELWERDTEGASSGCGSHPAPCNHAWPCGRDAHHWNARQSSRRYEAAKALPGSSLEPGETRRYAGAEDDGYGHNFEDQAYDLRLFEGEFRTKVNDLGDACRFHGATPKGDNGYTVSLRCLHKACKGKVVKSFAFYPEALAYAREHGRKAHKATRRPEVPFAPAPDAEGWDLRVVREALRVLPEAIDGGDGWHITRVTQGVEVQTIQDGSPFRPHVGKRQAQWDRFHMEIYRALDAAGLTPVHDNRHVSVVEVPLPAEPQTIARVTRGLLGEFTRSVTFEGWDGIGGRVEFHTAGVGASLYTVTDHQGTDVHVWKGQTLPGAVESLADHYGLPFPVSVVEEAANIAGDQEEEQPAGAEAADIRDAARAARIVPGLGWSRQLAEVVEIALGGVYEDDGAYREAGAIGRKGRRIKAERVTLLLAAGFLADSGGLIKATDDGREALRLARLHPEGLHADDRAAYEARLAVALRGRRGGKQDARSAAARLCPLPGGEEAKRRQAAYNERMEEWSREREAVAAQASARLAMEDAETAQAKFAARADEEEQHERACRDPQCAGRPTEARCGACRERARRGLPLWNGLALPPGTVPAAEVARLAEHADTVAEFTTWAPGQAARQAVARFEQDIEHTAQEHGVTVEALADQVAHSGQDDDEPNIPEDQEQPEPAEDDADDIREEPKLTPAQTRALVEAADHFEGLFPKTTAYRVLVALERLGCASLASELEVGGHRYTIEELQPGALTRITPLGRYAALELDRPDVVIVSCGGAKLDHSARAGELYTGSYHRALRRAAEALGGRVLILSAKHGLLTLDQYISPYDMRMGDPGSATVAMVREQAHELFVTGASVTVLGGAAYVSLVRKVWPEADTPLHGCGGMGEQLAKLATIYKGEPEQDDETTYAPDVVSDPATAEAWEGEGGAAEEVTTLRPIICGTLLPTPAVPELTRWDIQHAGQSYVIELHREFRREDRYQVTQAGKLVALRPELDQAQAAAVEHAERTRLAQLEKQVAREHAHRTTRDERRAAWRLAGEGIREDRAEERREAKPDPEFPGTLLPGESAAPMSPGWGLAWWCFRDRHAYGYEVQDRRGRWLVLARMAERPTATGDTIPGNLVRVGDADGFETATAALGACRAPGEQRAQHDAGARLVERLAQQQAAQPVTLATRTEQQLAEAPSRGWFEPLHQAEPVADDDPTEYAVRSAVLAEERQREADKVTDLLALAARVNARREQQEQAAPEETRQAVDDDQAAEELADDDALSLTFEQVMAELAELHEELAGAVEPVTPEHEAALFAQALAELHDMREELAPAVRLAHLVDVERRAPWRLDRGGLMLAASVAAATVAAGAGSVVPGRL